MVKVIAARPTPVVVSAVAESRLPAAAAEESYLPGMVGSLPAVGNRLGWVTAWRWVTQLVGSARVVRLLIRLLRPAVVALPQQPTDSAQSSADASIDDEAEDERGDGCADDESMQLANRHGTSGGSGQVWRDENNEQNHAQDAANELSYQTCDQAGNGAGANAPGHTDSIHASDEGQRQCDQKGQATQE